MKKAILNFAQYLLSKEQMKTLKGGYDEWYFVGIEKDPLYDQNGIYWCKYAVFQYNNPNDPNQMTNSYETYLPAGACTQ